MWWLKFWYYDQLCDVIDSRCVLTQTGVFGGVCALSSLPGSPGWNQTYSPAAGHLVLRAAAGETKPPSAGLGEQRSAGGCHEDSNLLPKPQTTTHHYRLKDGKHADMCVMLMRLMRQSRSHSGESTCPERREKPQENETQFKSELLINIWTIFPPWLLSFSRFEPCGNGGGVYSDNMWTRNIKSQNPAL